MMYKTTLLALALTICGVFGADTGNDANDVGDKQPPNEWGCYYTVPSKFSTMERAFNDAIATYLQDPNKKTECKQTDALFERWFQSSKDENVYIMSYYCRTKSARGFEHLKVQMSGDRFSKVLSFETSLKKFGIVDAGDYNTVLSKADGKKVLDRMLQNLTDQIAMQKNPFNDKMELCPKPSDQTFEDVETKKENGLTYYKIPIACNISDTSGLGADYMTTIEVVVDEEYKSLNNGNPVLSGIESPEKNLDFIMNKDKENKAKQKDDSSMLSPMVALMVVSFISRLF